MRSRLLLVMSITTLCGLSVLSASASAADVSYLRTGEFAVQAADGNSAVRQNRIAVKRDTGDVYVADVSNGRVSVYRPDGSGATLLTSFGAGRLDGPKGIAIDQGSGAVFVSDVNGTSKYVSDGLPTPTFTLDATFATVTATGPLAFDQGADELLLADASAGVVRRYSDQGAVISSFDGTGSPSTFTGLQDIAVDSTGDIIVIDSTGDPRTGLGESRIERFDAIGAWKATIGPVAGAATLGVIPVSDDVVVSGNQDAVNRDQKPTLRRFTAAGEDLGEVIVDDAALYSTISGIAADDGAAGRLSVATDVSAGSYAGQYGQTSVQTYDPVPHPVVATTSPSAVTATGATLEGTVNPSGDPTTYHFEHLADGDADWTATPESAPIDGTSDVAVSAVISGLTPAVHYRVRLVATKSSITVTSSESEFTADAAAPVVQTGAATGTGTGSTVLRGHIETYGLATTYHVEYGTTTLDRRAPATAEEMLAAGLGQEPVQIAISGLAPGTVYRYRLVAENAKGQTIGAVQSFKTRVEASAPGACPNAAVRAQQAVDLPDCRAYEQVTPLRKPQSDANPDCCARQVADAGDAVAFSSIRPLSGGDASPFDVTNIARRAANGWTTTNITPPTDPGQFRLSRSPLFAAFSPDLSLGVLVAPRPALTPDAPANLRNMYVQDFTKPRAYELITTAAEPGYAPFAYEPLFADGDAGFGHVLFEAPAALTPDAPTGGVTNLYEWSDGRIRLASVLPDGTASPSGGYSGATPAGSTPNKRNTISRDGRRVFFTDQASGRLFERVDDTTVEVSAIQRDTPDPNGRKPAVFRAATPDGAHVFFTSAEKLTDDATTGPDSDGSDLYRFDTETGELVDLTVDAGGAAQGGAGVVGVVGTSTDGTTIYFVAHSANLDDDGRGVQGQPNLYVWRNGDVHFIGTLKPAHTTFPENPFDSLYWDPAALAPNQAVSEDGERLVITSYSPLTGLATADTSQVYVYRADSESLECASCPPDGQTPAGDANVQPLPQAATGGVTQTLARSVTADGDHVFFTTPQALVARDVNGKRDVYEYVVSSGQIRLLSSGTGTYDTSYLGSSEDGSDVFVFSRNRLLASDEDSLVDIYDIRRGGGFLEVARPPACQGDQCQGPEVVSAAPPVVGSLSFVGPGDVADGARPKPGSVSVSRGKAVAGSAARLKVRVSAKGRIAVAGSSVRTTSRSATKAGTYTLTVALTAKATKTLVRKHTLKARVRVSFTPKSGTAAVKTLTLTFKQAKAKKKRTESGRGAAVAAGSGV